MWFDIMYASRARYEELLQQAEQERRAQRVLRQRPAVVQRTWEPLLNHLGSWIVQLGMALQTRRRGREGAVPVAVRNKRIST